MYDQEKKKSRGFGFLSFADESACSKAVAEHFVNIQSKQVKAIFFKSRYKKEIKQYQIDIQISLFILQILFLG